MPKLKRLRRWLANALPMPKRCKDRRNADRYNFESDDEKDSPSTPSIPTDRHRHVNFGATGQRPSKVTSFVDVPRVASSKRPRASSAPPAPRPVCDEPILDAFVDGVDHSYLLNDPDTFDPSTFEPETEDESEAAARVRTAGVRDSCPSSSHH